MIVRLTLQLPAGDTGRELLEQAEKAVRQGCVIYSYGDGHRELELAGGLRLPILEEQPA